MDEPNEGEPTPTEDDEFADEFLVYRNNSESDAESYEEASTPGGSLAGDIPPDHVDEPMEEIMITSPPLTPRERGMADGGEEAFYSSPALRRGRHQNLGESGSLGSADSNLTDSPLPAIRMMKVQPDDDVDVGLMKSFDILARKNLV